MKKRLGCLLAIGVMVLSGCGMTCDVVVKEDGTYTTDAKMYVCDADYVFMDALLGSSDATSMDEINAMIGKDKAKSTEERNGVSYYVFDAEDLAAEGTDSGLGEMQLPIEDYYDPSGMNLTTGGLYIDNSEADPETDISEISQYIDYFVDMKFTFPEEITTTNLKLSDDKKTVYIDEENIYHLKQMYAFSDEALAKDSKAPKAFADGKKIKNKKYYSGVVISFADNATGIKSAKLDGKKIDNNTSVYKKGNHKLVIEDFAGNKSTVKFTVKK